MRRLALILLAAGACAPPARDADGDGFEAPEDCCDSDPSAYPGAEDWHTDPDACGSFDWDCQAGDEPRWGGLSSLVYDCPASETELAFWPIDSWQFDARDYPASVVPCGVVAELYVGCNALAHPSPQISVTHAQECR